MEKKVCEAWSEDLINGECSLAKILFRPTCSNCGKQLYETISYDKQSTLFGAALFERGSIEPERCPYCNEWFESIEIPGLPFDNSHDKI